MSDAIQRTKMPQPSTNGHIQALWTLVQMKLSNIFYKLLNKFYATGSIKRSRRTSKKLRPMMKNSTVRQLPNAIDWVTHTKSLEVSVFQRVINDTQKMPVSTFLYSDVKIYLTKYDEQFWSIRQCKGIPHEGSEGRFHCPELLSITVSTLHVCSICLNIQV